MKFQFLILSVFWLLFFLAQPAYAYLDAGSGSMLLQLLLGGIAGLIVILKLFWNKFLGIFGISKKEKKMNK